MSKTPKSITFFFWLMFFGIVFGLATILNVLWEAI